jgi:hypothetical protein
MQAEVAEQEARVDAVAAQVRERVAAGQCGQIVARTQKIGRCLYAEPCGHRQGQAADAEDWE